MKNKKILGICLIASTLLIGCGNTVNTDVNFKEDINKKTVDKTYEDGSVTKLKEEGVDAQVKDDTLYINLDNSYKWEQAIYDSNVLAVLYENGASQISVKGLEEGHSALIMKGNKDGKTMTCYFNIIIGDDLSISFSESTEMN